MAETSTITVRLNAELKSQLELLAESTQRSKSWLASEAIAAYVAQQAWQIEQIEEALKQAEQPETQWVEHGQVSDWLQSWGSENESETPCP